MILSKKESLKLIKKYDEAYYERNELLVSDSEYDLIRKDHIDKYGSDEIDYVPSDNVDGFDKFKHPFKMFSLSKIKIKNMNEISEAFKKFGCKVTVQPKIDGLTIVKYTDEIRVTRGDGETGDILPLARKIKMGMSDDYVVRGEAYILKSEFEEINKLRKQNGLKEFENPRNAAAGILRNLDESKFTGVRFLAYEIRDKHSKDITKHEFKYSHDIELLKSFGYDTPDMWYFDNEEKLMEFILSFDKDSLPYEIDGLVIKCENENSYDKFGVTGHHPNDQVAIKFETVKAQTHIVNIEWSLGRSKYSPVAILEPTRISGSTVSRASVHNVNWIKANNLSVNALVEIEKSNEIIPSITKVLSDGDLEILIPEYCPECNTLLIEENGQLYCKNKKCIGRMINQISYMASKAALNIESLSTKTSNKILNNFVFSSWHDIFSITYDDLIQLDGFKEKSSRKLSNNIANSIKNVTLEKFIYCTGIDMVGKSTSKLIANNVKTYDSLIKEIKNDCSILKTLNGIGDVVCDNLINNVEELIELKKYITPIEEDNKIKVNNNALVFVMTGKFEKPKLYYQKIIEESGNIVGSSVKKETDYLIVGESAGSKLKKAKELNIKLIENINDLYDILKESN